METDRENAYIIVAIACSSSTINKLISEGAAKFVVHVECSNTIFRRAYDLASISERIIIPVENLNDVVEVNVFARAIRDIAGYKVENAHSDYGNAEFEIKKGDILAVGDGHIFYIESKFDSMKRIGSIMQIQEANEDADLPMRVSWNGDKIVVLLSKQDFRDYKLLKTQEGVSAPLTSAIVLPVLMEAIRSLKSEDEGAIEDGPRWKRALQRRIEDLALERETEDLIVAQKLLELPLKRSLTSARQFLETLK